MSGKTISLTLCLFVTVAWATFGNGDTAVEVIGGAAPSEQEAIRGALIEAVRMVNGGFISADNQTRERFADLQNAVGKAPIRETETNANIKEVTQGYIKSYRVLSMEKDEKGLFRAHLWVDTISFSDKKPREGRATIAVFPFVAAEDKVFDTDEKKKTPAFAAAGRFTESVAKAISAGGVFTLVSDAARAQAIASLKSATELVQSGQAPSQELVKAGKLISADYLISGHLTDIHYARVLAFDPRQGRIVPKTSLSLRGDFSVINVSTGGIDVNADIEVKLENDALANVADDVDKAQLIMDKAAEECAIKLVEGVTRAQRR